MRYCSDSKWIVYKDKDDNGKDGFFRVSKSGGEPQRLGDYPSSEITSLIEASPDARQFLINAVSNEVPPPEFWLLENFIPKPPPLPARPAAKVVK
jgi:hypothetical protein